MFVAVWFLFESQPLRGMNGEWLKPWWIGESAPGIICLDFDSVIASTKVASVSQATQY
jgi:hypothetical protein